MKLPNQPKVLAATYNPVSKTKMISFLVDFPTVLLAELRTHRILTQGSLYEHLSIDEINMSANSARAIPANKYLEKVLDNPFIPIWTKQQKGMSGGQMTQEETNILNQMWIDYLKGCKSEMSIDVNSNTTISSICFDTTDEEKSSGWIVDYEKPGIKDMYDYLLKQHAHKQNANRLLAPFAYTTCIISGTEWENFFELRCPKYTFQTSWAPNVYRSRKEAIKCNQPLPPGDWMSNRNEECLTYTEKQWQKCNESGAQPEFQIIAEMLYDLYQEANWKETMYHIPFEEDIIEKYSGDIRSKIGVFDFAGGGEDARKAYAYEVYKYVMGISASMCAKLSYNTQDNDDTLDKHLERAETLMTHKHWEPFSHQAVAMNEEEYNAFYKSMIKRVKYQKTIVKELGWCYNNRGFISQRYVLENY